MKYFKIILFLLLTISITNCSSDDDNPTGTVDPIIGTWEFLQIFIDGVDRPLDDCDKLSSLIGNEDGTLISDYYNYDDITETCEPIDVADRLSLWENLGNNVYRITSFPDSEDELDEERVISFEDNKMSLELPSEVYSDEEDDYIDVIMKVIFIRK